VKGSTFLGHTSHFTHFLGPRLTNVLGASESERELNDPVECQWTKTKRTRNLKQHMARFNCSKVEIQMPSKFRNNSAFPVEFCTQGDDLCNIHLLKEVRRTWEIPLEKLSKECAIEHSLAYEYGRSP
jgi:hypothetical protein